MRGLTNLVCGSHYYCTSHHSSRWGGDEKGCNCDEDEDDNEDEEDDIEDGNHYEEKDHDDKNEDEGDDETGMH